MTKKDLVFLSLGGGTLLIVLTLLWLSHRQSGALKRIDSRLDTSVDVGTGEKLTHVVVEQQEMTRQHISNTLGTLAHDSNVSKGLLYELRTRISDLIAVIERFVKGLS